MANNWSIKVSGRSEEQALRLADEQATDHFGDTPHRRAATQVQHEQRDMLGALMFVNLLVIYTTD